LFEERIDILAWINRTSPWSARLASEFLRLEDKIVRESRATAMNLLSCGRLADASILLKTLENIRSTKFLFSECKDTDSLPYYVELLSTLHDHGSARILQERLTVEAKPEVFSTSFAALNQSHQISCNLIMLSIKSCLKNQFLKGHESNLLQRWKSAEELEKVMTY
jgi:hypothetical protein